MKEYIVFRYDGDLGWIQQSITFYELQDAKKYMETMKAFKEITKNSKSEYIICQVIE